MSPARSKLSEVAAQTIAKFPQGTRVRHKQTGAEAMVGSYEVKNARCSFWLLTDGGHPTSTRIRAGRLLAEYEVI